MNLVGCKHLRIAGALEILLGLAAIAAIQGLLGAGWEFMPGLSEGAGKSALFSLFVLYGANGFKILAGLLGILLANRKSMLTVALGGLLFLVQLVNFLQIGKDMVQIIIHIILLVIPYYYLHNAWRNYRQS